MQIKQVEILSGNLVETEQFYTKILGFEIDEKTSTTLSFIVGDSKLIFRQTDVSKPTYHFAFNIPNNQLHQAEKWISGKIPLIAFEDKTIINFPNWNAKSVYFLDNNGNVLEFIARFDLENKRDNAFDSSGILSISEVAFVTDNVNALAQKILLSHGFTFFDKQIQREDFSVIGEDNGLLILVDSQRKWFPTSLQAESFWMKISIQNHGNCIELENK